MVGERSIFQGILTEVEVGGVAAYGRGVGGVFVRPNADAVIRFTVKRPGRYEFKCSIHPNMKDELLLLNIQAKYKRSGVTTGRAIDGVGPADNVERRIERSACLGETEVQCACGSRRRQDSRRGKNSRGRWRRCWAEQMH